MILGRISGGQKHSAGQILSAIHQNSAWVSLLATVIDWLIWTALLLIFGHLFVSAFFRFDQSYDHLAYHLPAALGLVGKTTFEPGPKMEAVIDGIPPLAHLVQGVLVWVSDRVSAANAHSALLFLLFCCILKVWFGREISLKWFLLCCLATPLFVFHFAIGYTDLFSGLCIALVFVALDRCAQADRNTLVKRSVYFIVAAAAAMLSKYQAWPVIFFPTIFFLALMTLRTVKGVIAMRWGIGLAITLILLIGIWPLRNTLQFKNPTYPFTAPLLSSIFNNAPFPVADSDLRGQLPQNLWDRPLGYRFIYSVLEVGRFIQPGYIWSYDQNSSNGYVSPHHRIGGFSPLTFLLLIWTFFTSVRAALISNWAAGSFFLSLMVVMNLLPANHELRYWLYLPMTLSVWTARYLALEGINGSLAIKGTLIVSMIYVIIQVPILNWSAPQDADSWSHPAAQAFWSGAHKDRQQNICGVIPYAIYWAGPKFNTYPVKDLCL